MHILVTGGTGFIGCHVSRRLLDLGHRVTVTSGGERTVPGAAMLYKGQCGILGRYKNADAVIHLSANNDTLCNDQTEMIRVNVADTFQLFTDLAHRGCKRFVYASSTAVYGNQPAPYDEAVTKIDPQNSYAASKAAMENRVADVVRVHKVAAIGLRFCNVYGPGEFHKGHRASMIHRLIRSKMEGRPARLFWDGEQKRDWVHVSDVVEAVAASLHKTEVIGSEHKIYNVGSGVATSFTKLHQLIYGPAGRAIDWLDPPPSGFQTHTQCNIEAAGRDLNWQPEINVELGVSSYLDWVREEGIYAHPASDV